jgi:hypothetical protein
MASSSTTAPAIHHTAVDEPDPFDAGAWAAAVAPAVVGCAVVAGGVGLDAALGDSAALIGATIRAGEPERAGDRVTVRRGGLPRHGAVQAWRGNRRGSAPMQRRGGGAAPKGAGPVSRG